jgi:hypothetical protein
VPSELLHPNPLSPETLDASRDDDAVDPELLALPAPPKAQRQLTVALLAVVAVTASLMAYSLRGEAAYALAPARDVDLGELYSVKATAVDGNTYARAHGALGGALAVRFERPFESDTYRVSPVMGRRDLWVEVRVRSGEEGGRYVPPTAFAGRLVRWDASGLRHRGLEGAVDSLTHEAIPSGAWLLVDGESPDRARWALALGLIFAGFAVWSVVTAGKMLRRVE